MSRSGYSEDLDQWNLIRWRGQVASAIRSQRGQAFLRDLLKSLDEMSPKRLIRHELEDQDGEVCALGALAKSRGVDLKQIDPEDYYAVAAAFGIAHQLAREIMYMNDELGRTPEERWIDMRAWVRTHFNRSPA